ncbi:hypothetical protein [Streptomyces sp. NPDC002133]|uniref:hypothetical protein n=1 Tax=Streptomyces sp. NPDC002133 TaxID=3154409 RepID=UPI00331D6955
MPVAGEAAHSGTMTYQPLSSLATQADRAMRSSSPAGPVTAGAGKTAEAESLDRRPHRHHPHDAR